MDQKTELAAHETTELHEIIKSLTTEVKVLQQYSQLAKEQQTKSLITNAINVKQNQRGELEQFIKAKGILQ
ncbi:MAG: hypothetical protein APF84_02170 [Gracilibacter sp. BRH_c7a]|nr:MAG: hypothetical protein APF84_02170 [Gracilibacter sp. BRH_c7a]